MANYISKYFDIFYEELDDHLLDKIKLISLLICIGLIAALMLNDFQLQNPLKKIILSENVIFGDLGFPSVILVNKSLKALCLSSKMVCQYLHYLLSLWKYWHLKFTQGPTDFFNGNFRGCKMADDFTTGLQWAKTAASWNCQIYTDDRIHLKLMSLYNIYLIR